MNRFFALSLLAGGIVTLSACKKEKPIQTQKLVKKQKKGYPDWILNPYPKESGMDPRNAICAAGQSNLGLQMGNTSAALDDARMQIQNQIATQIETEVGLLQERVNNVMRDMSTGRDVGELSLKTINRNFQKTQVVGLRYIANYVHPDYNAPEKVYVLGCVTVDFANMARDLRTQMLSASEVEDVLEFKHQKSILRFEEVEKEYLKQREDRLREKGLLIDQPQ